MSKPFRLAACALTASGLVAAATASGAPTRSEPMAAPLRASVRTQPATRTPWLLASARQFRLKAPPAADSARTKGELRELRRLQKTRTAGPTSAAIAKWVKQPAVVPWTELAIRMIETYGLRPAPAARALALLETGMDDAIIAAEDSRVAHRKRSRPAPWVLDKRLSPAIKVAAGSTYAPYDAAIAGVAETVLALLFPGEPRRTFIEAANQAVGARLAAGLNYRSDVELARSLGRKVASLVIARNATDGSRNSGFTYPRRNGEAFWIPTPENGEGSWTPTPAEYEGLVGGAVGTWKPWLLSAGSQLLNVIPGPSAYGSPEFMKQLRLVLDARTSLTDAQRQLANFWDDPPGSMTPAGRWMSIALQLIKSYKVAPMHAARVLATVAVTEADAAIASYAVKYYHWSPRPITAIWRLGPDGGLRTEKECAATPSPCPRRNTWYAIVTTPPSPSYPSDHTTFASAAAKVLAYFFPKVGQSLNGFAAQVATSRLYGGSQFDEDARDGLILGAAVADIAIARVRQAGAGT